MPLRAFIDKEEIISIDLNEKQWDELRKRLKLNETELILPCCQQKGFLRRSSKGLRHFVHSKSDISCDWKPESPDHLRAKIEIMEACKENGWNAVPEFSESNWRADVLAIRDDKRIAFEVQWSNQTYEVTKYRQERYKESNVRGCWFFKSAPREMRGYDEKLKADKDLPAFKIFKDENSNLKVHLRETSIPLKTMVSSLLNRRMKFCKKVRLKPKQEITIVFYETNCWKCKKPQHLWTVEQNLVSVCAQNFYYLGSLWNSDSIDKNPKVVEAVTKYLKTSIGEDLKIGLLKRRFSKTVQDSYLSHGCFYCDAIFGDFFLSAEKLSGQYESSSIRYHVEIEFDPTKNSGEHWCYSEEGHFCE